MGDSLAVIDLHLKNETVCPMVERQCTRKCMAFVMDNDEGWVQCNIAKTVHHYRADRDVDKVMFRGEEYGQEKT